MTNYFEFKYVYVSKMKYCLHILSAIFERFTINLKSIVEIVLKKNILIVFFWVLLGFKMGLLCLFQKKSCKYKENSVFHVETFHVINLIVNQDLCLCKVNLATKNQSKSL